MRNYEVTFIVDPVLSSTEIDSTASSYQDHLKKQGCSIVNSDAMGLRQLAYPINKRTSGVYFCIEFQAESHDIIERLELALRRDERIMRFLTVKLDKYGVKYNDDKRNGLIGKGRLESEEAAAAAETAKATTTAPVAKAAAPAAAVAEAPVAEEPVAEAPVVEEPVVEEPVAEAPAAEIVSDDAEAAAEEE